MSRSGASKFAALSIAAALATISLKTLAWWLTDSVGLLSDAIEGTINLAGATVALAMISWPRDLPTRSMPLVTARPSTSRAASRAR